MPIDRKDVEHVAELARLALTSEEAELYTTQLKRILGYVEKLSALDTKGIEPLAHASGRGTPMRDDAAGESIPQDEALRNAPSEDRGCFKVPKIIE